MKSKFYNTRYFAFAHIESYTVPPFIEFIMYEQDYF